MKVSREQVAENRRRILEAASRLFRERGFDGVGVDAIMKEAGLTHGGFYGHFRSKDDLIAQAVAYALAQAESPWASADDPLAELAALYLSEDHRKDRTGGCLIAALGSEVVRQSADARRALSDDLRSRVEQLERVLPGRSRPARRRKAVAAWAGLVGSLILSRAVDDPAFAEEIREAGRTVFGGLAD